jgi:hypothetical protein
MAAAQPATQGHCVEIGVSCLITSARYTRCVMRGLNPRLHQKKPLIRQAMDCPVKPLQ